MKDTSSSQQKANVAIAVRNLSKTFFIPHEKISTLRSAFIRGFRKQSYEKFHALDDVSFTVKKGEFFGILGRNGSGKSTLLKILAGIYTSNTGEIDINGRISPFLELGIGFNPELSGRDNVYLNGTVLGLTKKQIDEKFNSIVGFSELERFIDQKIKNYSSGMQVRLAFSVAIHANRDILLMDEVLAVGDTNFQQKCIEEFNRYRELGKTVILVTHDMSTVERYCDRALLLRNGTVQFIGDPEEAVGLYMKQNMADEETRMQQEDVATYAKEYQTGINITSVEFLDSDGDPKKVFPTGADITARIHYATKKRIEKPVFGIALHTQDGIHLTGPNTKTSKIEIPFIEGEGFVDFTIEKNPLLAGKYDLTVALFDWDCVIPFDYHDRAHTFKIISMDPNQHGVVKIDHHWTTHL
jgi:ABC-type polysaccharide/polyol phosphate transport system ATPase subunit